MNRRGFLALLAAAVPCANAALLSVDDDEDELGGPITDWTIAPVEYLPPYPDYGDDAQTAIFNLRPGTTLWCEPKEGR